MRSSSSRVIGEPHWGHSCRICRLLSEFLATVIAVDRFLQVLRSAVRTLPAGCLQLHGCAALGAELRGRGEVLPALAALLNDHQVTAAGRAELGVRQDRIPA